MYGPYKNIIIIFLSIFLTFCKDNIVDNNKYYYDYNCSSTICKKINDDEFEVKLDKSKFQTFVKFDISTNNQLTHYIDWDWKSRDTFFVYVNGINAGPLSPTNKCSVLYDGKTSAYFGFHKSSYLDTIYIKSTFIDSKVIPHIIYEKYFHFIVK